MYILQIPNYIKILLLSTALFLSLVYNYNFEFWTQKEYQYYQLFLIILTTLPLFLSAKDTLNLSKIDYTVIIILLLVSVSRIVKLRSINELHIINSFLLILYYLSIKTIHLAKEEIKIYYKFVIAIGFLLSLYCILELWGKVSSQHSFWKMLGNFSNPAPLGGFIAVIITMLFSQLLRKENLKHYIKIVVYLLIAMPLLLVLVKSGSRAAVLSGVIALLVLLSKSIMKWRYAKIVYLSILPLTILIFLLKGTDSIYGRLLIWKIAFLSFIKNPVAGMGYGYFTTEYSRLQAEYFQHGGTKREILLAAATEQSFNECLKFSIENGILGITVVLACLFWTLKSTDSISAIRKNTTPTSMSVYVAILVFAQFSYPFQFLPFKLLLLNEIGLQQYPALGQSTKISSNYQLILLFSMGILMFFAVNYQYKGFRAWKEASELQFSDPGRSAALYRFSAKRLENEAAFLSQYANTMEEEDPQTALNFYNKAKKLTADPRLYRKTAQLNEKLGYYQHAEADYLRIHLVSPHLFSPLEQLLDFYNRIGNNKKSNYYAKKILYTPVKIPGNEVERIKLKAKNQLTINQITI